MQDRLVAPLQQRFDRTGADRAQLRAEIAVAAFHRGRAGPCAETLEALAAAEDADVVATVELMLAALG